MKELWDKRYASEDYAYGKKPNTFFSAEIENIPPGKMLLPGEGEGRNAVHAAMRGWTVEAFDQSSVGHGKALALASELGAVINYRVCQMDDFPFGENRFDAIGLIYFHSDRNGREKLHTKVYKALKPGGSIILEAFHKEQLKYNTGGPKSLDLLYNEETLAGDFAQSDILMLEKQLITLNEGPFHQGEASVIRFHGIKSH